MGDVIRGKNMAVQGENTVDGFEIHSERDLVAMAAGNTDGGVIRSDGNDDWWGWYRLYGHTPARFPNDEFTFLCAPVNTGVKAVSGTAKCQAIDISWDIRNARYIQTKVFFGAHGALSLAQTAPTDTSEPGPLSSKGMYVNWGGLSYQSFNIDMMRLRIGADHPVFGQMDHVDSSTNGQTNRTDGDVDAVAQFRMYTDDSGNFPTRGLLGVAQFYVTVSTYWQLSWMRIRGVQPWEADRQQNKQPVSATITMEFTAHNGTSVGSILNPAGATKWP